MNFKFSLSNLESLAASQKFPEKGWVGFDLDGTLAKYDHFEGWDKIGDPIEPMIEMVKSIRRRGIICKVWTARASVASRAINNLTFEQVESVIKRWTLEHIGEELDVVTEKDCHMLCAVDDSVIQVEKNTGKILGKLLTIDDGFDKEFELPCKEINFEDIAGSTEWNVLQLDRETIDKISAGLVHGGFAEALPPDDWRGSQWLLEAKTSENITRLAINTMKGMYEGVQQDFVVFDIYVAAGSNRFAFKYSDINFRAVGNWLAKRILQKKG